MFDLLTTPRANQRCVVTAVPLDDKHDFAAGFIHFRVDVFDQQTHDLDLQAAVGLRIVPYIFQATTKFI